MRRWLPLLCFALLLPALAQAAPAGTARVTARMAPDGVLAEFALDRPVTRFAFAEADVVREGDFELLSPGLRLEGNAVTAIRPFTAFRVRIRPMSRERDAKYPAHFRVGEGGVVYAPALAADPAAWRTRLSFKLARGQVRAPSAGDVSKGFVFIGPRALRSEDRHIVLVADPKTPPWLVERTRSALAAGVAAFTKALGARLPRKPLLIVQHQAGERSFNVGDVTPGAVTSLRFHGPAWLQPDANAAKHIQSFVLHEAFHFWNGGLASHAPDAPTWLHEGGAEYASLLAGLEGGVLTQEDVRLRLAESLRRCRTSVQQTGDKALAEMDFLTAQVRYPCGMLLQWAADLRLRGSSGGGRTVLHAWADVLRAARARPARTYTLEDFYAAAGIERGEAFGPVALIVHRSGPDRWQELPGAFAALGAEVALVPSQSQRRYALIFHLLRENCIALPEGTGFGFYTEGKSIRLDSPKQCGSLAGDPVLRSVEGGDPFEMSADTYAAVQRRCAAKSTVTLTTADGREVAARCTTPLPTAPDDYQVNRWTPGPG